MRSLADACGVSREKLAFIVDATAAPIASIVPISSWVGFEVGLIQEQLTTILEQDPNPDIATTGFGVFLETIQYRYYCIFMLFLLPLLVVSGRDMGHMLIAERKTKVYGRTDGGDGAAKSADGQVKSENMPEADTPCKWWNMAVPIASLVGYIFYLLAYTGQSGENDSFMKMMENSNSYQALLWGTMAAALTSIAFFFIQDKKSGKIIFFNVKGYVNKMRRFFAQHSGKCGHEETESDEEVHAQVLLNYREAMSAFMMGMEKVFGALVCLVLAWATGEIMQAVGLKTLRRDYHWQPRLQSSSYTLICHLCHDCICHGNILGNNDYHVPSCACPILSSIWRKCCYLLRCRCRSFGRSCCRRSCESYFRYDHLGIHGDRM